MKTIKKLFSAAIVLFAVTACQSFDEKTEVIRQFEVSATIVDEDEETKVLYNNTNHIISTQWAEDDQIIGFDNKGTSFTFTVSSISSDGKNASFDIGDYSPEGVETLYAIYYPGKTITKDELDAETVQVNLESQGGVFDNNAPFLMCAKAGVDGNSVNFSFKNQTAIIGVEKFQINGVTSATKVDAITLNGVKTKGEIKIVGNEFKLVPSSSDPVSSITADNGGNGWTTDDEGIWDEGVYFAAIPTSSASMMLDATVGNVHYANLTALKSANIEAGKYYYMSKKLSTIEAIVISTHGETPRATIDDAFSLANSSTSDVTIKLLANCTASDALTLDKSAFGDCKVTLDLNGQKLTTITSGNGILVNNRTLTIEDNSLSGTGVIESESTDKYLLSTSNQANVTILSGTLKSTYRAILVNTNAQAEIKGEAKIVSNSTNSIGVDSYGTLDISGKAAITSDSYGIYVRNGITTISENATVTATESGTYGCCVTSSSNSPTLKVNGGTIKLLASDKSGAIYIGQNGTAEISGGTIEAIRTAIYVTNNGSVLIKEDASVSSTNPSYALINANTANKSQVNIKGGRFSAPGINPVSGSGYRYVTGGVFNRPVNNLATHDASDKKYYNSLNTDDGTKDAYPYCVVSSESAGVSLKATSSISTFGFDHASFESAIKHGTISNNDITIAMNDNVTCDSSIDLTNQNGKTITFDINGQTVTSNASPAFTTSTSLTIKDSQSQNSKGILQSNQIQILYVSSGLPNIVLDGCVIKCTADPSDLGYVIQIDSEDSKSSSRPNFTAQNNAIVVSTGSGVRAIGSTKSAVGANYTLEDCYITSKHRAVFGSTGTVITINEGASIYSENEEPVYLGSATTGANMTINGGYFYGDKGVNCASKANVTITGGYFNHQVGTNVSTKLQKLTNDVDNYHYTTPASYITLSYSYSTSN